MFFFFFKQKTAYEMRISDWSSDVCSSDLGPGSAGAAITLLGQKQRCLRDGPPLGMGRPLRAGTHARRTSARGNQIGFQVPNPEIGSASCRERVCQYVSIPAVAVSLKKKQKHLRLPPLQHEQHTPHTNT